MSEWIHEGKPPFGSASDCWMASDSVRRVTFDSRGWRFADCTHPLQNAICDPEDIRAWRLARVPNESNYPPPWEQGEPCYDPLINAAVSWLWR